MANPFVPRLTYERPARHCPVPSPTAKCRSPAVLILHEILILIRDPGELNFVIEPPNEIADDVKMSIMTWLDARLPPMW